MIVSHGRLGAPGKTALLNQLYAAGKKIITTGINSTSTEVPWISGSGSELFYRLGYYAGSRRQPSQ